MLHLCIESRVVQFVFLGARGFDKVCESFRTLEMFEGFDVQFGKRANGLLPPPSNLPT